ncbi:MAG TPA: hypothetical protein VMW38_23050, partial [Terriglobia bacterium]|nr:hypothetical protein [Terriglobia bacterium]
GVAQTPAPQGVCGSRTRGQLHCRREKPNLFAASNIRIYAVFQAFRDRNQLENGRGLLQTFGSWRSRS